MKNAKHRPKLATKQCCATSLGILYLVFRRLKDAQKQLAPTSLRSYRIATDDKIELHKNSQFMPHAGNQHALQFSPNTRSFSAAKFSDPLPSFLCKGFLGGENPLNDMSAVHLTLHLLTPRTSIFYNERVEPLWRREPSLQFL